MQFIPNEAYEYLEAIGAYGANPLSFWDQSHMPVASGEEDAYTAWYESHQDYIRSFSNYGQTSTSFYLVLKFPKHEFSEQLEMHERIPMMVPASGVHAKFLGVYNNKLRADAAMAEDTAHVHLVYNLKIKSGEDLQKFLELMADNHMIESAW